MKLNLQAVIATTASSIDAFFFFVFQVITYSRCKRNRGRSNPEELSSIAVDESGSFNPKLRISMEELCNVTEDFHPLRIIGNGGFGLVYKACLTNGFAVAIKKLEPDAFEGFQEFRAEMETLGKLQHPNIIKILGYCTSNLDRILVYEFIERGSLNQWLYNTTSPSENDDVLPLENDVVSWSKPSVERLPLSWDTRMKIIKGVANGLAYMHRLWTPIIHRDIKASNVLLDAEFEVHIVDFGLARMIKASQSHVSTQFAGTMGYMPLEYKEGFTVATVKGNVNSFSILMIEVATCRRPNLPVMAMGREVELTVWA